MPPENYRESLWEIINYFPPKLVRNNGISIAARAFDKGIYKRKNQKGKRP